jgi:hypothetical protein
MAELHDGDAPQEAGAEAFVLLVLRYLDCLTSAEEFLWLCEALRSEAGCRDLFVRLCRLDGGLTETYAARRHAYQGGRRRVRSAHLAGTPGGGGPVAHSGGDLIGDASSEAPAPGAPPRAPDETEIKEPSAQETHHEPPAGAGATDPPPDDPSAVERLLRLPDPEAEAGEK